MRSAAQQIGGIGAVGEAFEHLVVVVRPMAMARLAGSQPQVDLARKSAASPRIDHERFSGDAFGIDDLVIVKEQLEIFYLTALALIDRGSVDQVTDFDENL